MWNSLESESLEPLQPLHWCCHIRNGPNVTGHERLCEVIVARGRLDIGASALDFELGSFGLADLHDRK